MKINSKSLDQIACQISNSPDMEELDQDQKQFVLEQFKKMYAQQMGKVALQLQKRSLIKNHKTQLQQQQQLELKKLQENLQKKMTEHSSKRQKYFSTKVKHSKEIQQNWQRKMQDIHKKQKQQLKKSQQKALEYRKQAETFWSQSNTKKVKKQNSIPAIDTKDYFKVKTDMVDQSSQNPTSKYYHSKIKSQSNNQIPRINKTIFPTLKQSGTSLYVRQNNKYSTLNKHQHYYSRVDDQFIKERIKKSKMIKEEKQEFILKKALQKLQYIENKRQQSKNNLLKSVKEAKQRRQLRQDPIVIAERRKKYLQQQSESKKHKKNNNEHNSIYDKHSSIDSSSMGIGSSHLRTHREANSIDQSIIKHKQMKHKIEEQQFYQRDQVFKTNLKKEKKGKMLKAVKQTLNKIKHQALKDGI